MRNRTVTPRDPLTSFKRHAAALRRHSQPSQYPFSRAGSMEGGESILDAIFEEDNSADAQDVEMLDVEEGELLECNSPTELGQSSAADTNVASQEPHNKRRKRRGNKRKNKRKKGGLGPNVTDINRFVLDVCKRLKEKKSYLVWTAVACLGVAALSDLVKEVYAIQACGGQKTADGQRFRTGGGILWSILKTREPNAYQEIMRKGKEFEKQLRQQNIRQEPVLKNKEASSGTMSCSFMDQTTATISDGSRPVSPKQSQLQQSNYGERKSVHDRIRVPVSYDDLLGEGDQKDEST